MRSSNKQQLFTLILAGFLTFGCSKQSEQTEKKTPPPLQIQTITLKNEPIAIWQTYTGKTKASSNQKIRTRVAGILQERYFKDGEIVHKGQKLFKIQQDEYQAALDAAHAKKAQDEAALELAKADVARYKPLVKEGLAPRATLEQYQSKMQALQASIQADKAQIKQAELNLSYTIIKAPISGKISARYVDVGNYITPNQDTVLTTIISTNPLYAYFSPSTDEYLIFQKYKKKDKTYAFIELKSSLGDIREDGYVDFTNNIVDPLTSTITMRAVINNKTQKILPGSFVYVNIYLNTIKNVKTIPPEIIFNDQLGEYVYVVDENNTLRRADIQTGFTTKHYAIVEKGLKFGDRVAVSALVKLKPSLHVTTQDVTDTKGVVARLQENNLQPKEMQ